METTDDDEQIPTERVGAEVDQVEDPVEDPVEAVLPAPQMVLYGLQHVLAMYAGAITIPLLISAAAGLTKEQTSLLVAFDLFTCGVATLIQAVGLPGVGIKLPAILGTTFAALSPLIVIVQTDTGGTDGLRVAFGAVIVAGVFVLLVAPLYGKLLKFFPTVVTGTVVMLIGITLIPTAMENLGGGSNAPDFGSWQNLLLGVVTLSVVILSNLFFKGFMRSISVLNGIAVGTALAAAMGRFPFHPGSKIVALPQPFVFGWPKFDLFACITLSIVMVVVMIESTGTFYGIGKVVGRDIRPRHLVRGLRAEGLATALSGIFNSFPHSTFNQNLGLLQMSRIYSRYVVMVSGGILILLGVAPPVSNFATAIPKAVIGGATIVMFASVALAGLKMLRHVDFNENRNLMVVSVPLAVGVGVQVVPNVFHVFPVSVRALLHSGIVVGAIVAVVTNMTFNWRHLGSDEHADAH